VHSDRTPTARLGYKESDPFVDKWPNEGSKGKQYLHSFAIPMPVKDKLSFRPVTASVTTRVAVRLLATFGMKITDMWQLAFAAKVARQVVDI